MTAKQIEEIRARADLVSNRIGKLASGKERFKMCIPPQPYDDDIAIATLARTDVPALLADNDALRKRIEKLERLVKMIDANRFTFTQHLEQPFAGEFATAMMDALSSLTGSVKS